ncbi:COG3650 family protein [Shimia marina]|uniref:Putative membrane protein n=1 Tax=Shimia marina TaxID=321267 RepID=A0A0P1EMP2_9RHOB|nr:SH3 domain-containing protein [Shimia marina]CUH51566.1 putative membrane protein [Shimia marina]SFD45867.1 SH3 domain-containing protein [Shimia marina]
MIRIIIALCLWPLSLWADPLPALYDVVGVEVDDTLNIRRLPNASAAQIGALPNDARDIEVTAQNDGGTWARINIGEGHGWVSARYLTRSANPGKALHCFGTEPFWSAKLSEGQPLRYTSPDEQYRTSDLGKRIRSANLTDRFALQFGPTLAMIKRAECSDGMSDRLFGLEADLLLNRDGTPALLSGCCSIVP